ncbi:MAG TPA: hypothetical protein VLY85_03350 [Thermoplasmata archaeon]|nr:hypothetical protein [Thermoplasmata archaeon]
MGGFRGSDETLDREIDALERIARLRVRRYARDLSELQRDLSSLRKERARRLAESTVPESVPERAEAAVDGA